MAPEPSKFKAILDSKWTWIGGGIGALGIIYYYHKSSSAAAAAATSANTTAADTTSTDTTDSSGYGYDSQYSPIDDSGIAAYGVTPTPYYSDTGYTTTTVTPTISTNNQWAQAAETNLVNAGYDSATAAAAIGKYLLGAELTAAQVGVVQAAIGLTGQPPTPIAIHTAPAATVKYTVRKPPPGTKFVEDSKYKDTWEIWPDGTNHYVSPADYIFLGSPKRSGSVRIQKP